jgi:hypothetical protein
VIRFTIFAKSQDKLDITLEEDEPYEFRNVGLFNLAGSDFLESKFQLGSSPA